MTYAMRANQYCRDVLQGSINVNKYVKLACKRHLDNVEQSMDDPRYPYYFDEDLANIRCAFSEELKHVKDRWAGQKIKLSPHQVFFQAAVWGWVRKVDRVRRFTTALLEVPRKNGKSTDAATTGLYMLVNDGVYSAEVYSGATTEKQALEVFRPAWQMVYNSPALRNSYRLELAGTQKNPTSIYRPEDMSRFEPLIGSPGDGASPSCAIIDEYHEHRSSDQYNTMSTGMGARTQPLILIITTAGTDTSTPCYDLHLQAIKMLEGVLDNDALFALIFGIDPDDDYKDFNVWIKANPNYGISLNEEYLRQRYVETLQDAAKENINKCKHLNVWTNAGIAWMNMAKWEACYKKDLRLEMFKGQASYAALDLANKIDICALILLFPVAATEYAVFGKYYLPEEVLELAGKEHYWKWYKEGRLTITPGASTDYAYIEEDIRNIHKEYPIIELAYDPREATYLIHNLMPYIGTHWVNGQDQSRCVEINQSPANISEPMKELEAIIYDQRLQHTGDPILTWMVGNVIKRQGRGTGTVKCYYPSKERESAKIDGAVALIMAIGRAMAGQGEASIYESRDPLLL